MPPPGSRHREDPRASRPETPGSNVSSFEEAAESGRGRVCSAKRGTAAHAPGTTSSSERSKDLTLRSVHPPCFRHGALWGHAHLPE